MVHMYVQHELSYGDQSSSRQAQTPALPQSGLGLRVW